MFSKTRLVLEDRVEKCRRFSRLIKHWNKMTVKIRNRLRFSNGEVLFDGPSHRRHRVEFMGAAPVPRRHRVHRAKQVRDELTRHRTYERPPSLRTEDLQEPLHRCRVYLIEREILDEEPPGRPYELSRPANRVAEGVDVVQRTSEGDGINWEIVELRPCCDDSAGSALLRLRDNLGVRIQPNHVMPTARQFYGNMPFATADFKNFRPDV